MTSLSTRPPPTADFAELAALGHLLQTDQPDPEFQRLRADYFSVPVHRQIFEWIRTMSATGIPVTPGALAEFMGTELDEVGGPLYLAVLVKAALDGPAVAECVDAIVDTYQRRSLVEIGRVIEASGLEIATNAFAMTSRAPAQQQLVVVADWLGQAFAMVTGLIDPMPPHLARPIDKLSIFIALVPHEVRDLAAMHDIHAQGADLMANQVDADLRRDRAAQLRQLIGEAQP